MKTALITGIRGQDGYYLGELLVGKGYRVIGITSALGTATAPASLSLPKQIEPICWDLSDQRNASEVLSYYRPSEIYNLAAYASGVGMFDDPIGIGEVNGIAVTRILEAIREVDMSIRFCQASSSEMFGEAVESPQSERTAFYPRSPYGAAKLYAHEMIRIYRQRYGIFACSAILFNHESPRRGFEFVTRKITHTAARIKRGLSSELSIGNLDARRDWGFAKDYMNAMWLMQQASSAEDYVVATGETHSVRELCECAFGYLGLDYKEYVHQDPAIYRSTETTQLVGCPEKARRLLGWMPEVNFRDLVKLMVDADLQLIDDAIRLN